MFDLFILSLPPALGYAISFAIFEPLNGFEEERWNPSPGPGGPLWSEIIAQPDRQRFELEIAPLEAVMDVEYALCSNV